MTTTTKVCLVAGVAACAAPALAQTNVSPTDKWAWSENCGFLNWHDAGDPIGAQGAVLHDSFLSGFVWGENIGWINLGDGTPTNGTSYANATGADAGVNRNPATNALSGLAWAENVGWINFAGGANATPPNPARYDAAAHRLRGYAWGENIGWINLDNATDFVAFIPPCRADFNNDNTVNSQDFFDFLTQFFATVPAADFNSDGVVNSQDFFDFLTAFFTGC